MARKRKRLVDALSHTRSGMGSKRTCRGRDKDGGCVVSIITAWTRKFVQGSSRGLVFEG